MPLQNHCSSDPLGRNPVLRTPPHCTSELSSGFSFCLLETTPSPVPLMPRLMRPSKEQCPPGAASPPRSPSQGRRDPLVSLEASFTATKFRSSHLGVFWRTCPGPRPGEPRRGGPGSPAAVAHFAGGVLTKRCLDAPHCWALHHGHQGVLE